MNLIPSAAVYDEHRAMAAGYAARATIWAVEKEMNGKKWGSVKSNSADTAVALWDATLRYSSEDRDAIIRSSRARALAICGRFDEAVVQAQQVYSIRKKDPHFLYDYACMRSCAGRSDKASLDDLSSAMTQGSVLFFEPISLKAVKLDPNLEGLRQKHAKEYAEIVRVKFEWSMELGIFSDTIWLVNKSAFPITNVSLNATVSSTGYSDWGPQELKVHQSIQAVPPNGP